LWSFIALVAICPDADVGIEAISRQFLGYRVIVFGERKTIRVLRATLWCCLLAMASSWAGAQSTGQPYAPSHSLHKAPAASIKLCIQTYLSSNPQKSAICDRPRKPICPRQADRGTSAQRDDAGELLVCSFEISAKRELSRNRNARALDTQGPANPRTRGYRYACETDTFKASAYP